MTSLFKAASEYTNTSAQFNLSHLRDALSRLFLSVEKSGRYLFPSCILIELWGHLTCLDDQYLTFLKYIIMRTEQEATTIYDYGMKFLRTHKLLTSLSQRRVSKTGLYTKTVRILAESDLTGTIYCSGLPCQRYMCLGFK